MTSIREQIINGQLAQKAEHQRRMEHIARMKAKARPREPEAPAFLQKPALPDWKSLQWRQQVKLAMSEGCEDLEFTKAGLERAREFLKSRG